MRKQFTILALATCVFVSQPVNAWNLFGHEAVAYVAYQHLTPKARERANALLKLNPMYSDWLKEVSPDADQNTQIFMLAATWPDVIKVDHGYNNDKVDSPECRQNLGYSDMNQHRPWHYADIPYSQDHTKLPPLPRPNAKRLIPKFRKVLASHAPDDLKSYDLCWLIHVVGDVHQPLHCITRATKSSPNGDNGGNDVKLTDTVPNLHKFWDDVLGPDGAPITAVAFAKTLEPANSKLARQRSSRTWIKESHRLAIEKVYQSPIGQGDGPYTLTDDYKTMAGQLAKERVELAGERLANLLNGALK